MQIQYIFVFYGGQIPHSAMLKGMHAIFALTKHSWLGDASHHNLAISDTPLSEMEQTNLFMCILHYL